MEIDDTFGFLLGKWQVTRSIEDLRFGSCGSFEGVAVLGPASSGSDLLIGSHARYEEVGDLCFGTYKGESHRSLEFKRQDDSMVELYFIDGRRFVDLDLSTGKWRSDHRCGDDLYEIATWVRSPNVVQEQWRVQGPTKDYVAVTTLTRSRRVSR